jgi:archaellum biogenesis protein FlaJ (TadC family)
MANILEKTAMDLRDLQIMRKEISASMVMYSIFIGFSAAIGAPFLYVVSHRLIMMFEQLWSRKQIESSAASVQGVQMAAPGINSADFSLFAVVFIVITTVIATAMISVIQTGSKRNALKYVLPFLTVALLTFYVGGKVLGLLFGAVTL